MINPDHMSKIDVQKMKIEVEDKYGVGGMCAFLP
jgi:hypothetical protein